MNLKSLKLQAEKAATTFRRNFDLGTADPIYFDSLLVKLDLTTVFAELSESFSGMAAKINNNRFMLINCCHPKGRQHFTICHELYHLFIQEDFSFERNTGQLDNDIEKLANHFASALLMPEAAFKEILSEELILQKRNLSLDDIVKLEQYFQVSRMAILYRLKGLKLINSSEFESFNLNVISSAEQRGYDTSLYHSTSKKIISSDYHEKAKNLYESDVIGLNDYANLLSDIDIDIFQLIESSK